MKRRSIYVLIASTLCLLVPAPGRFVFGVTLILELNLIMLLGTLFSSLIEKFNLKELKSILLIMCEICITILFRQIMIMLYPEIILTLGFLIYVLPLSLFVMGYLFSEEKTTLKDRLKLNMIHSLTFSIYGTLFFLFRDVVGYGTFTFFGKNHQIFEKVLLPAESTGLFSIVASIPGALVLSSLLVFIHITVRNKFAILQKVEVTR